MNTLIHADIFFFITSIVVVVLAICIIAILIYVLRIIKNVSYIVEKIKRQSDSVAEDIEFLREKIRNDWSGIYAFVRGLMSMFNSGVKKKKKETIIK